MQYYIEGDAHTVTAQVYATSFGLHAIRSEPLDKFEKIMAQPRSLWDSTIMLNKKSI